MTALMREPRPRYQVVRRLGVGGMAEVFLAHEPRAGRLVALKRLLVTDDADRLDLFLDEARIAARFRHPNIVGVHELGCDDDGLYLALEYVAGRSLAAVLGRSRRGPPLPRDVAVWIVAEVARALGHVHGATDADGVPLAVVHRDVSPPNVLVSRDGDVKLTDFGIAKARDAAHRTGAGVIRGTTGYMSPEQLGRGAVDARSDVWSLGVLLWETTLGRRLFAGDDPLDVQRRIIAAIVPPPASIDPDYPAPLEALVLAALDGDPARRPTAAALEAGLRAHLAARGDPPCRAALAAAMEAWFGADLGATDAAIATVERGPTVSTRRLGRARRRRLGAISVALAAALVALPIADGRAPPPPRPAALDAAWTAAQRGGHEQAALLLDDLLATRAGDPEVLTLAILVHWWLGSRQLDAHLDRAELIELDGVRRAVIRTIGALHRGRAADAVEIARRAEARHRDRAELAYVLGEALWHDGDREAGARWLAIAAARDPRWSMALHHPVELWAARGDGAALRGLAAAILDVDPAGAAGVEIAARLAEGDVTGARDLARRASVRFPDDAALWLRRAGVEAIAGELGAADRAAGEAAARWPLDERDRGATAHQLELHLYRGDEGAFLRALGGNYSFANVARLAFWHDAAELPAPAAIRIDHRLRKYGESAMAPPPLFECASVLAADRRGEDARAYWSTSSYPEVRAYGAALAAARADDAEAAARHLRDALAAATADTRPLFAYHLARLAHAGGDGAGAAAACAEVLRPRAYVPYRAVLARDCTAWVTR